MFLLLWNAQVHNFRETLLHERVHLFDQATENLNSALTRPRLLHQSIQHASTQVLLKRLSSFDRLQNLPAKSWKINRSLHVELTLGEHGRVVVAVVSSVLIELGWVHILVTQPDRVEHSTFHEFVALHGRVHISVHLFGGALLTRIWVKNCWILGEILLLSQRHTRASLLLQSLGKLSKVLFQFVVLFFKVGNAFLVRALPFESIHHRRWHLLLFSRHAQT